MADTKEKPKKASWTYTKATGMLKLVMPLGTNTEFGIRALFCADPELKAGLAKYELTPRKVWDMMDDCNVLTFVNGGKQKLGDKVAGLADKLGKKPTEKDKVTVMKGKYRTMLEQREFNEKGGGKESGVPLSKIDVDIAKHEDALKDKKLTQKSRMRLEIRLELLREQRELINKKSK